LTRLLDTRKGQHDYHYDPLDRLTRADHSQDPTERFAHDPANNLLMQDRPGPGIVVGNRLLLQGDRHYDYDAFGNLIRERRGRAQQLVTEYRYDCQHRLTGVTQPDGSQASYRYDPFGRRISKTVAGKTTEFFWQGDKVIAEHTAGQHRSYLYEPDSFRPLALLEGFGPANTQAFHYQLDHLGTPQELTNTDGKIVWSAHYQAYGKITRLDVSTVDNPLRFQGQYFDRESGLHYNRHRYYNPDNGRYLTPDPVKLAGGLNGYLYVPNPTGWVDPLGLNTCPGESGCKPAVRIEDPTSQIEADHNSPAIPNAYTHFPSDPNDFTEALGVQPKISTTKHGTQRMEWRPNTDTRIRFESHPGDPGPFSPRHHGNHYHIELKPNDLSWKQSEKQNTLLKVTPENYQPGHGTGFLPGEKHPGS
ncbi:RHS repeat domain-containing protein, partial [Pseudomonas sp. MF6768]